MLFNNRRSESDIVYDLLLAAQGGIKKTSLMHKANMPYNHFVKYFNMLLEKDVIGEKVLEPEERIYYTTDKGKKLLVSLDDVLKYFR